MNPNHWITKSCHRLITYTPAGQRVPGCRSSLDYSEYHSGMGSDQERVAWADTQTGYHDCRIALCIAKCVPLDLIDPSMGHDLSQGGWEPAVYEPVQVVTS